MADCLGWIILEIYAYVQEFLQMRKNFTYKFGGYVEII